MRNCILLNELSSPHKCYYKLTQITSKLLSCFLFYKSYFEWKFYKITMVSESESSRNVGFIFDFILWGLLPIFLITTFGWIIFCISQIKHSYYTWRYHRRNSFRDSHHELYNSRNKLIRNILLLTIVLAELGIGSTVMLIQTLFASDWVSNRDNITINSNCTLDKTSWLYDFESVSPTNWFLEGLRQVIYVIELSLYRLTILHLEFAYRKELFTFNRLLKNLLPPMLASLLVLVLSSFSQTYWIGFGISLIVIQVILIKCVGDARRLHLVISWAISDYENYNGITSQFKLRKTFKTSKRVLYLLYASFQIYVFSLFLYFVIVLVIQTFLENPCWITANFYLQIPKLQFDKNIFSMICNVVWIFRTITALVMNGMLCLLSLLYFCSVLCERIRVEIRVSKILSCLYKQRQFLDN